MAVRLPETAPVMVLPDCNFFPGTPQPLYIFEPRYRAMLEYALQGDRMFCIGTRAGETALPVDDSAGIYEFATLGLIRACVKHDDGTSNLILEGLCRVVVEGWMRETPFGVAYIRPIPTTASDEVRIQTATEKLHELAMQLCRVNLLIPDHIRKQLQSAMPPETLVDMIAFYLIDDIHARHALLGMEDLLDRISFVSDRVRGKLTQFPDVSD